VWCFEFGLKAEEGLGGWVGGHSRLSLIEWVGGSVFSRRWIVSFDFGGLLPLSVLAFFQLVG
jgi:hypothetical protein